MQLTTTNLGRKFGPEWIFKGFSYTFQKGGKYAIVGNNGSGKSTLLKILSACLLPSEGEISYTDAKGTPIEATAIYNRTSLVGPYTSVIEDLTLKELIVFFRKFKPLQLTTSVLLKELKLIHAQNKLVKHFSSGMKQRLQLGLAFYSHSQLLLLDEPTSNLDTANIDWYHQLVDDKVKEQILIISSNQTHEYSFCKEIIHIRDFK